MVPPLRRSSPSLPNSRSGPASPKIRSLPTRPTKVSEAQTTEEHVPDRRCPAGRRGSPTRSRSRRPTACPCPRRQRCRRPGRPPPPPPSFRSSPRRRPAPRRSSRLPLRPSKVSLSGPPPPCRRRPVVCRAVPSRRPLRRSFPARPVSTFGTSLPVKRSAKSDPVRFSTSKKVSLPSPVAVLAVRSAVTPAAEEAYETRSTPASPLSWSLPGPPKSTSSPTHPSRKSFPGPPTIVSPTSFVSPPPALPTRVSLSALATNRVRVRTGEDEVVAVPGIDLIGPGL